MRKIVSPNFMIISTLFLTQSVGADLFATVVGSAISSGASGYMKDVVTTTSENFVQSAKTFDNEYNEAVCSFDLENMRQCINNSLVEIDSQARKSGQILKNSDSNEVDNSVFIAFAKSAVQMTVRYELAVISIDFIRACKKSIFDLIDALNESKSVQFNARVLGGDQASQFERSRDERVSKAVKILEIWKNNLLAALHEKYPYDCEGGWKDRYVRSTARHKKRAKEWRIPADWLGYVSVPKVDLKGANPFESSDSSAEARAVASIEKTYQRVFEFMRLPFDQQISQDAETYLATARKTFAELFPGVAMSSVSYDVPEILTAYRQYVSAQQGH